MSSLQQYEYLFTMQTIVHYSAEIAKALRGQLTLQNAKAIARQVI
jgi:hypothetical protein